MKVTKILLIKQWLQSVTIISIFALKEGEYNATMWINLVDMILSKINLMERTIIEGFHLNEVFRVVKFIEG